MGTDVLIAKLRNRARELQRERDHLVRIFAGVLRERGPLSLSDATLDSIETDPAIVQVYDQEKQQTWWSSPTRPE